MNFRKFKQYFGFFVVGALGIAVILVWTAVLTKAPSRLLVIHFFDIGQGKAIFIELPDGNQILIDGGPDNAILEKLSSQMGVFDREIDMVILTHPDADHLNGLVEVLKRYNVGKIMETGILDSSAEYQAWNDLIKAKNIPMVYALAGEKIKIGGGFVLEILYPNRSLVGQSPSNTNSSSIVLRLVWGKNSFLFTGDTEASTESYLVATGAKIDSDILDVSHHGSKSATGEEFLAAVTPETAVIQASISNRYGHPAQETLNRLGSIKILRNDLCGDIDIFSDGQRFWEESNCQ